MEHLNSLTTPADVIDLWPSAEAFAADIGLKHRGHGRVMKLRGAIPSGHWDAVEAAAKLRGLSVSHDDLVRIHVEAGKRSSDVSEPAPDLREAAA